MGFLLEKPAETPCEYPAPIFVGGYGLGGMKTMELVWVGMDAVGRKGVKK